MAERRYNEQELARILREAGKYQLANSDPSARSDGFSLAEIQQLATEVGIDPAHVATAAARLGDGPARRFRALGASPSIITDRKIPGQLSDEQWEDIVSELRATVGGVGTITAVGSGREWLGGTDLSTGHLSATVRDGETRLRLTIRRFGGITSLWTVGMAFTFMFVAMACTGVAKQGAYAYMVLAAGVAVVAACLFILNRIAAGWESKNQRMMDSLMQRIEAIGTSSQTLKSGSSVQAEGPEAVSQLSL